MVNQTLLNPELSGKYVKLIPLNRDHASKLCEVGNDRQIWQYLTNHPQKPKEFEDYVELCIQDHAKGNGLSYAIVRNEDEWIVGLIRLTEYSKFDERISFITWITPPVWRTAVNTESKLLLLTHCFEELPFVRVQFKVDNRNIRSQRAIERIGATEEGLLRQYTRITSDIWRDDRMYSIIKSEWSRAKERIQNLMAFHDSLG